MITLDDISTGSDFFSNVATLGGLEITHVRFKTA
jgi:hypothetical protein